MRIVFMGTPEFAVASLDALVASGANVVGVVTATDKLGGRGGKQLLESAVKKAALRHDLPVLQPPNLKGKKFLAALRALKPDLQVVVAFRMLPRLVWDLPPLGTVNVHGSLLPAYRGAAPIHWAVVRGETQTGVSVFFLKHAIDTGNLLLQKATHIGPDETTGEVYERLMAIGAAALVESLALIEAGETIGEPQDETRASHAPKIFHADAEIDFSASAKTVHDFVRGMSPFPAAWMQVDGKEMKVLRTAISAVPSVLPKGELVHLTAEETHDRRRPGIGVATATTVVELVEVKPAGKRKMSGADWKNGRRTL